MINQPATVNFSLHAGSRDGKHQRDRTDGRAELHRRHHGQRLRRLPPFRRLPVEGDIPDLLSLQPGVLYLGLHNDQSHDSRSGSDRRSALRPEQLDSGWPGQQRSGSRLRFHRSAALDARFRAGVSRNHLRAQAETGRSSGAQINILTKSGTNQFHGSVYGRTRDLISPANDWFNKQAELAQGLPNVPGTLDRNTYGASLGGPIARRTSCSSSPRTKARRSTRTSR